MVTWIKSHNEMFNTILSGILTAIGFILEFTGQQSTATIFFIFAIIIGAYYFTKEAFQDVFVERHLTVGLLMLLATIGACIIGYWSEGAALIFIYSLAESLEDLSIEKSKQAITELMNLTPPTARRYQENNTIVEVPTSELKVGDRLQVPKGETIPIDGSLMTEYAVINESAITGESLPVTKYSGEEVIGGTLNVEQTFDTIVTTAENDTLFAKVIQLIEEAQSTPSKTASFIEQLEEKYVKAVLIGVPIFIVLVHFVAGWTWVDSFYRGMVLLTVASPCALVSSATPATLAAISRATKFGILFKGGIAIDNLNQLNAIVFDKTGTLTNGRPEVTTVYYRNEEQAELINQIVKTSEASSTHPIATALIQYLSNTDTIQVDQVKDITGFGFEINYEGQLWRVGKPSFANGTLTTDEQELLTRLESEGKTVILVTKADELMALYALSDEIKAQSKATIKALQQLDIRTIMLTGDNERAANYIATQLGIDEVKANCLPADKASIINELHEKYPMIAMVGDGINDAPALATADVGIAMGSGTDIAMETADVVLMKDDLSQIVTSIKLSHAMRRIIIRNITFALAVIVCLIISNVFQFINLPLGVVGHEGSTILVILNGLRLLRFNPNK